MADQVEAFLQVLSAAFLLGCLYGLMCAGLGLIFGIMRVINFAQGDFMMLAMYAGLNGVALVAASKAWAFPVAMAIAGVVALLFFGLGTVTHWALVSRVSGSQVVGVEDGGHTGQLILTLGLSLVLQNGGLMVFGSSPTLIPNAAADRSWMVGPLAGEDLTLFFNQARTWSAAMTLAVVGLTIVVMARTGIGRQLRAVASNPIAALYMGIDVDFR